MKMFRLKLIGACLVALLAASAAAAQKDSAAQATGGVKGRVEVDSGHAPSGVVVAALRGEDEVARVETDRKGQFELGGLAPGVYRLTFRKSGLKSAELKQFQIRAGKVGSLGTRVFMPLDEGSIAFLSGSVFDAVGRSVRGARVELSVVGADGSVRKIDGRVTNQTGQFTFRLRPDAARYRVRAKAEAGEDEKEIEIEGAMIYRVALSLKPGER